MNVKWYKHDGAVIMLCNRQSLILERHDDVKMNSIYQLWEAEKKLLKTMCSRFSLFTELLKLVKSEYEWIILWIIELATVKYLSDQSNSQQLSGCLENQW